VKTTLEYAMTLECREAEPGDGLAGVLSGVAVPYGDAVNIGGIRESFAPNSIDAAAVVGMPLCWRHGDPIGVIREAHNAPHGLVIDRADVADTTLGRDAVALLRSGAVRGLSVGVEPIEDSWNAARTVVTRIRAALFELSLTHMPMYAAAGVTSIREDTAMSDTDTMTAPDPAVAPAAELAYATKDEVAALRERFASVSVHTTERTPKSGDDFLREYARKLLTRAWTDITLDGTASDKAPMPADVSASVFLGRPTVATIGVQPLTAEGMDAHWMLDNVLPTVGKQTAEKTLIPSGPASGQVLSAPVETFAGGNDLSIQWIQRASVWDYPHYLRLVAEQYARNTNVAVCTTVTAAAANTITIPTDLTDAILGDKLGWAAAQIAAGTGRAPDAVVLDPEGFFRVATIVGAGFPVAGGVVGNANLAGLSFRAFGLPFVCDPTLVASGYVLDTASVGIKESPGAPFDLTANVPSKLGVDYAAYGFLAHKVLNAEGIVSVIVTPSVAAAGTRVAKK
jgi:HK97 family phage prohead protease